MRGRSKGGAYEVLTVCRVSDHVVLLVDWDHLDRSKVLTCASIMPLSILGSYFKIPRHDTQCRWRANRRIIHDMHRTYGLILPLARLWNFMRQVPGCALVVLEPPRLLECHFSIPGITLVQTDRLHSSAALILAKECLSTTRRH